MADQGLKPQVSPSKVFAVRIGRVIYQIQILLPDSPGLTLQVLLISLLYNVFSSQYHNHPIYCVDGFLSLLPHYKWVWGFLLFKYSPVFSRPLEEQIRRLLIILPLTASWIRQQLTPSLLPCLPPSHFPLPLEKTFLDRNKYYSQCN